METAFGEFEIGWAQPFLGPVDARAAGIAKEWILDVHSHDQFIDQTHLLGGTHLRQRVKFWPAVNLFGVLVKELPTQSAGHSKPGVVGSASANTNETPTRAVIRHLFKEQAETFSIQFERVIFTGRKLSQSDDASRFDNSGPGLRMPPPDDFARSMGSVHYF